MRNSDNFLHCLCSERELATENNQSYKKKIVQSSSDKPLKSHLQLFAQSQ